MSDPQGASVVINGDDGKRHVFPPGFDPVKAAAIVREQAGPKGSPWDHPIDNAWEGVKTSLGKLNPFAAGPSRDQETAATLDALKQPRQPFGGPADIGRSIYKGVTSITPQQIGEGATDLAAMYAGGKLAGAVSPETISRGANAAGKGIEAVGKGAEWVGDQTMKGSAPAAVLGATTSHTGSGMAIAAAPVVAKFGGKGLQMLGKAMQSETPSPVDRYLPNASGVPDQGIPQGEMPQPTPPVAVDRYMPNTSGTPDGGVAPGPLPQSTASMVDPHMPNVSGTPDQGVAQGPLPQPTPPVAVDRYMPNASGTPDRGVPQGEMPAGVAPVEVDRYLPNSGGEPVRDLATFKTLSARPEPDPVPPPAEPEPFQGENQERLKYPSPAAKSPPVKVQPDDAGPAAMQAAREKYGSVRDAAAALKTDPKALADATEGPRGVLKDPKAIARIAAAVEKIPPAKRAAEAATTNNPKFREALLASLAAAGVKPEMDD